MFALQTRILGQVRRVLFMICRQFLRLAFWGWAGVGAVIAAGLQQAGRQLRARVVAAS
jgi:hypothetical protein